MKLFLPKPSYLTDDIDPSGCLVTQLPAWATRVYWDGGLTAGGQKTWDCEGRPNGLYCERGQPVQVGERLRSQLPPIPLDGFLYSEDGQQKIAIVGMALIGVTFEADQVLAGDKILTIDQKVVQQIIDDNLASEWKQSYPGTPFSGELLWLEEELIRPDVFIPVWKEINSPVWFPEDPYGRYLIRSWGSTWDGELKHDWLVAGACKSFRGRVTDVTDDQITTTFGTYQTYERSILNPGDPCRVYLDEYDFVIGVDFAFDL